MSEYEGREQSLVKHFVLRKYLERFAHIIGSWKESITYVDCFSGPWNVHSKDLHDSSFAIALAELRKAKHTWEKRNRKLRLRCFFLEKQEDAYAELRRFAESVKDADIRTKHAKLKDAVSDILRFLAEAPDTFPFILVDPTGWTGFELDVIAPLLKLKPGEVLVNFMTSFIRRFIKSPDEPTRHSFDQMYGRFKPSISDLQGLSEEDLGDALVDAYKELLQNEGAYPHTCNAIVLHPDIDSTHFHLIYATRNLRGVQVFKEAERKAMAMQEETRADLRGKKLEQENLLLFARASMGDPRHFEALQRRYSAIARSRLRNLLNSKTRVSYDTAYAIALSYPIVQERDLRLWIGQWRDKGLIKMLGMTPRQRVPQIEHNNVLERVGIIANE